MERSLAERVEAAAIESAWRRPDSVVIERDDWFQITTPSAPIPSLNGVLRCALSNDDSADAVFDETIASYRARGLAFRWLVSSMSRPRDLRERLEARGLVRQHEILGLAADPALLERRAAAASRDVDVELLRSETVDEWVDASAAGYEITPEEHAELRLDVARLVEQRESPLVYVLARVKGEPAGTGAVRTCRDGAYFIASSVVPRFRNRGVYTALVGFRAALARQAGQAHVFTLALASTSAPICLRLGFEEACRMTSYQDGIKIPAARRGPAP